MVSSPAGAAAPAGLLPAPAEGAVDHRVYLAITGGATDAEVERLIEQIAQGDDERRKHAVAPRFESPLQAAFRLDRGNLACRLLVKGADVKDLYNGEAAALAVCCMYGEAACVSELIAKGHDLAEVTSNFWRDPEEARVKMRPVHVCAAFMGAPNDQASRIECLRVLVEEGGADINARDENGDNPMHWLASLRGGADPAAAVGDFASLGADFNARSPMHNRTPIFAAVVDADLPMLSALLAAGASPDDVDKGGWTSLMFAAALNRSATRRQIIERLIEVSSPETLRAVNEHGDSAAEWLLPQELSGHATEILQPWEVSALATLHRAGAPVVVEIACLILPSVAAHGIALEREMAARRSESRRWRAHDEFVQLAFDARDAREAEERVRAKEARVRELEEALGEGGGEGATEEEEEGVAARVKKRRRGGGG